MKMTRSVRLKLENWKLLGARSALAVGVLFPTLLFPTIALFSPQDILSQWPSLSFGCQSIRSTLLQATEIDFFRHARSTTFPEVATLGTAYGVLWWAWTSASIFVLSVLNYRAQLDIDHSLPIRHLILLWLGVPILVCLCLISFFALPGDPSFANGLTSTSRGGYAFMGTIVVAFASGLTGFWPMLAVSIFTKARL